MNAYLPGMDKFALVAAALVLAMGSASAQYTATPVPTVEQAHQHIGRMLGKYQVKYLVWYGPGQHQYYKGYVSYYSGNGCMSEFGSHPETRAFGIDWSKISSVRTPGGDVVYAHGELVRASSGRRLTGFHLYLADTRTAKSVWNALEVLRSSCVERSIFDVASR